MKDIGQRIKGVFHLTKQRQMVQKLPGKFPEIPETVEFPKSEPFKGKFCLEIPGAKMNGKKTSGRKLGIPREGVLFFGSFEKCYSICYWKIPAS